MLCPICSHTISEPRRRHTLTVDNEMDRDMEVEVTIHAFDGSVSAFIDKTKAEEVIRALKNAFNI